MLKPSRHAMQSESTTLPPITTAGNPGPRPRLVEFADENPENHPVPSNALTVPPNAVAAPRNEVTAPWYNPPAPQCRRRVRQNSPAVPWCEPSVWQSSRIVSWSNSRVPPFSRKILFPPCLFLRHAVRMGKRREARERAVQFLFQYDLNSPENLDEALNAFWESQRLPALEAEKGKTTWGERPELPPPSPDEAAVRLFSEPLIRGVIEHRAECDEHIMKHAKNWELHRMAAVDRNVLRLAIYEMLHRPDIPPVVSINEAVDIAKKFSTQDSGKFVNGILDQVKGELMRPARNVT